MDRPLATCKKCATTCDFKKMQTFSYWWCPKCKDEPQEVRLITTGCPKAEKYGYLKEDNDYLVDAPGIYKLVYIDGSIEFYERKSGQGNTILDGSRLRSAKRLTESDLPSRKPVQSLATTSQGAQPEGQSLRALSDEKNSPLGHPGPLFADVYIDGVKQKWDFTKDCWIPDTSSVGISSDVSKNSLQKMQNMEASNKVVQFRKLPKKTQELLIRECPIPEDEL